MPRSALLIINRHSRQGESSYASAKARLEAFGFTLVAPDLDGKEAIQAAILENGPKVDCVIIGGGDGTLNGAAPALRQINKPLGILPLGTANDLARTLTIPAGLEKAIDIIAAGREVRIDLGLVNDQPFFNVASIGLSSDLAKSLTREVKQRFGRLGYALTAMKVLTRARPFRARIMMEDASVKVTTLQIAVGNGRYYGGGMTVEKSAAIDDGQLDLYSLELKRAWKLAFMARAFRAGEHGAWQEVRAVRGERFTLLTRRPRSVNADGEIVTKTPARFEILKKAIRVYVP